MRARRSGSRSRSSRYSGIRRLWTIVTRSTRRRSSSTRPAARRRADVRRLAPVEPALEPIERYRDRIAAVHLSDWRDPTRNTNDRVLPGDGVVDYGADPGRPALGRALRPRDLLRRGAARTRCGTKTRGSSPGAEWRRYLACLRSRRRGHRQPLRRAPLPGGRDVSVLCRREEHARGAHEHGLRVSGRHEFIAEVAARRIPPSFSEPELASSRRRRRSSTPAAARLAGHWPAAAVMTVQNGLGAEEIVRRHGAWRLVSAVTFMSGTRHADTTSSTSSTPRPGWARSGRHRTRW